MNSNVITGTPIKASSFSWEGTNGVAEISDFGREFRFHQVYQDACDEGMTIISDRTQDEIVFVVTRLERDKENELVAWHLSSLGRYGRIDGRYTLTIFND